MNQAKAKPNPNESEELIEHILQSLVFNFYIVDARTYRIVRVNDAARQGRDIGGMTCHLLTHQNPAPCDSEEHGCPLEEVKRTGVPATMVHTHFDKDGNPPAVRGSWTPHQRRKR